MIDFFWNIIVLHGVCYVYFFVAFSLLCFEHSEYEHFRLLRLNTQFIDTCPPYISWVDKVHNFCAWSWIAVVLFWQVVKPLNQVLSSLVDQEAGHQIEQHDISNYDGTYTVEEFEVRILEPERSGGPWQTKGTIPMQTSENALTVRVVTLLVSLTWPLYFLFSD